MFINIMYVYYQNIVCLNTSDYIIKPFFFSKTKIDSYN